MKKEFSRETTMRKRNCGCNFENANLNALCHLFPAANFNTKDSPTYLQARTQPGIMTREFCMRLAWWTEYKSRRSSPQVKSEAGPPVQRTAGDMITAGGGSIRWGFQPHLEIIRLRPLTSQSRNCWWLEISSSRAVNSRPIGSRSLTSHLPHSAD